ncbi:MAG: hypothetical protein KAR06_01220 [Deltaproteobacteria bacterium]|nr:hypothetical protein [Deltaproteobacteria bacterium]
MAEETDLKGAATSLMGEGGKGAEGDQNQSAGNEGDKGKQPPEGGNQGETFVRKAWANQFPDELKDNELLNQHENMGELGQAFLALHAHKENSISIPGEDASDVDKAAFAKALGVPEKPEGYDLVRPKDAPEGIEFSDERDAAFKTMMHGLGFNQAQAQGVYDAWNNETAASLKKGLDAYNAEKAEAKKALQDDWNNDYDKNVALSKQVLKVLEVDETAFKGLHDEGLTNNPHFARLLHSIATKVLDDTTLHGGKPGGGGERKLDDSGRAMFTYKDPK